MTGVNLVCFWDLVLLFSLFSLVPSPNFLDSIRHDSHIAIDATRLIILIRAYWHSQPNN